MTQQRYKSKFSKISQIELVGAIICYLMAAVILINFNQLNSWYLALTGVLSLSFLITLPTLVLQALWKIKRLNPANGNFSEVIVGFTKAKKQLLMVQKSGFVLNMVFILVFLPVVDKILNGKDIFLHLDGFYVWFIPIAMAFLFFFTRWVYRCYQNITSSAEEIIMELQEEK